MNLLSLCQKSRSYRKFNEGRRVTKQELLELINLARFAPSSVNRQALRFMPIYTQEKCALVFPALHWAGLLKNWEGPKEGERPAGYILILTKLEIAKDMRFDCGIAAQTIMLGANEKGLGGCILGAIDRDTLYQKLNIDKEKYSIDLCLAIGEPNQNVKIVPVKESTDYYVDENEAHCVPKLELIDLIVGENDE